jgi:metal-responsive CopG/Arc/MetJ family transcriptional regulator
MLSPRHNTGGIFMGKNISVYLDDNLLGMVASSGKKTSEIVQDALKQYFQTDNRRQAFKQFAEAARELGDTKNFQEVVKDWETDRENDRW